jgi:hypothetical protein
MFPDSARLPHLIIQPNPSSENFTSPSSGMSSPNLPERDRELHGQHLKSQLEVAAIAAKSLVEEQKSLSERVEVEFPFGSYLEFSGEPGFALKLDSLENLRSGVELVAVKQIPIDDGETKFSATVFVKDGQLPLFERKIDQYLTEENIKGEIAKPKNQDMVESISAIRLSTLEDLWTDIDYFPPFEETVWWEVWLRAGDTADEQDNILSKFRQLAEAFQLTVGEQVLKFPENTVVLVYGAAEQLQQTIFETNLISELRRPKRTAEFYFRQKRANQQILIEDFKSRISLPSENAPAVCLLDTGVNYEHPLISELLSPKEMDSYNPAWGNTDDIGHGTAMAGLGLYGDLVEQLNKDSVIELNHRLESVKILSPQRDNPPYLYGNITIECVARAETFAPNRQRAICLTATTTDFRDRGQPTSWSAAIDALCSGADEEDSPKRLCLISAGNTDYDNRINYPNNNLIEGVHDPGQAWNALTVGAFTNKVHIPADSEFPDAKPLAPAGGLSPCSTTSLIWENQWAYKPDIVLEGGNLAGHPTHSKPFEHLPLRLLSTNYEWVERLFIETGDTSAATAQAARIAAIIYAHYPDLWAETVRGLLIHSANWTEEMLSQHPRAMTRRESERLYRNCLRSYGYGVPDLERALYSARNTLTLISQTSLQPFKMEKSAIKANQMNLHQLPMPKDVLQSLGETDVEMRVTLSYFIEPNPARRGAVKSKHKYASHGLRFATNSPTESANDFRRRINRLSREEGDRTRSSDTDNWVLGADLRTRGSIHSDIWRGTAAELASKEYIAVFPVGGWWKELRRKQKWDSEARYSLIITLDVPKVDVDIYTPVANLIVV